MSCKGHPPPMKLCWTFNFPLTLPQTQYFMNELFELKRKEGGREKGGVRNCIHWTC